CTNVIFSAEAIAHDCAESKAGSVSRIGELFASRRDDLASFLASDPAGQKLPEYIAKLGERLLQENATLRGHVRELLVKMQLMKQVIASQQDYARGVEVREPIDLAEVIVDSLHVSQAGLIRSGIEVQTEVAAAPHIAGQRLKLLHVLINLIKNAKEAMIDM